MGGDMGVFEGVGYSSAMWGIYESVVGLYRWGLIQKSCMTFSYVVYNLMGYIPGALIEREGEN
jgi:hypothetical protein